MTNDWSKTLFQCLVVVLAAYCVVWAIVGFGSPALEWFTIPFALGLGVGLLLFYPLLRLVFLLTVVSCVFIMINETEFWMFDTSLEYGDLYTKESDPTITWHVYFFLVLTSVVLLLSYLPPIAAKFGRNREPSESVGRRNERRLSNLEGATISCLTVAYVVFYIINELFVSSIFNESSINAQIAEAEKELELATSQDDIQNTREAYFALGALYWDKSDGQREALKNFELYLDSLESSEDREEFAAYTVHERLMALYAHAPPELFDGGRRVFQMARERESAKQQDDRFQCGPLCNSALAYAYARLEQFKKAENHENMALQQCLKSAVYGRESRWKFPCKNIWEYVDRLDDYSRGEEGPWKFWSTAPYWPYWPYP